MFDISNIDSNFKIETTVDKTDIKYYKVDEAPFKIYGVFKEGNKYRRMPENVARNVSDGVYRLHTNTAGGRVKFVTDSPYITICAKMDELRKMSHVALTGSIGFDLYVNDCYVKTFVPPFEIEDGYESIFEFEEKEQREITINFPLYSNVNELYIGLQESSVLTEAKPYKNTKPIVFYGSSITQGACASRPGTCHTAILSRWLESDFINLGFSGKDKGEEALAKYISTLDMSAFVYAYGYNAPTAEHFRKTYYPFYEIIRKERPELPIIMMGSPICPLIKSKTKMILFEEKRKITKEAFEKARQNGDNNIYYIDGFTLLENPDSTVDGTHPSDLGFYDIANAVYPVLKEILSY